MFSRIRKNTQKRRRVLQKLRSETRKVHQKVTSSVFLKTFGPLEGEKQISAKREKPENAATRAMLQNMLPESCVFQGLLERNTRF